MLHFFSCASFWMPVQTSMCLDAFSSSGCAILASACGRSQRCEMKTSLASLGTSSSSMVFLSLLRGSLPNFSNVANSTTRIGDSAFMPLKSFSSSWITCRSENQYKTSVAQLHQNMKLSIQNMESSFVHDW